MYLPAESNFLFCTYQENFHFKGSKESQRNDSSEVECQRHDAWIKYNLGQRSVLSASLKWMKQSSQYPSGRPAKFQDGDYPPHSHCDVLSMVYSKLYLPTQNLILISSN